MLDNDGHENGENPLTRAGSLYELVAPSADSMVKPVGEFNTAKIIAKGTHLEHWLNGIKVLETDINSADFAARIAKSKFKDVAGYGTPAGPIMLQDHGGEVWFRNIRIRRL